MVTVSYDLGTDEEAFDVALKIDLTFKRLVNATATTLARLRCFVRGALTRSYQKIPPGEMMRISRHLLDVVLP